MGIMSSQSWQNNPNDPNNKIPGLEGPDSDAPHSGTAGQSQDMQQARENLGPNWQVKPAVAPKPNRVVPVTPGQAAGAFGQRSAPTPPTPPAK